MTLRLTVDLEPRTAYHGSDVSDAQRRVDGQQERRRVQKYIYACFQSSRPQAVEFVVQPFDDVGSVGGDVVQFGAVGVVVEQ